jgi:hypothetical protein
MIEFVGAAKILVESLYFIWWPTDKNIIDHLDDEHFQRARLSKNKNLKEHQERQRNLVRISIFQWLAAKVGLIQLDRMQGAKVGLIQLDRMQGAKVATDSLV